VIAAVNGLAIGGGFELAMACDLIVAAEHAAFALPETKLGVAADAGGLQRLPRQLPYRVALELLLLGRRMPASEALHHGLINAVVPADQVMATARGWARTIVEGGAAQRARHQGGGARERDDVGGAGVPGDPRAPVPDPCGDAALGGS
jgi:crotonobetainyl-CoA hydratase